MKIGEAARLMGTSVDHLRQWEKSGERLPARKTKGGTRDYDAARPMTCDGGPVMDRDLNAAINLAKYAASSAVSACGVQGAGAAKSA